MPEREKTTVYKDDLLKLIKSKQEQEQDLKQLYDGIISILEILGVAENNQIKEEYLTGEESFLPEILKSGGSLMLLFGQTRLPGRRKIAEQQIHKKFGFVKEIIPTCKKYKEVFYGK